MMDRRTVLAGSAAMMGLTACGPLTSSSIIPGRGWIIQQGEKIVSASAEGQASIARDRTFNIDTPFRIASITKLVVAIAIRDWAKIRKIDLSESVSDILPETPDTLTLDHLLSHRSGLKDPEIYWADVQTDIRTLYSRESFTHAPDTYFRYANLNYGLAATVVEARLGERFDRLIGNWLMPQGFDAGLNWSGVSQGKRRNAAALYRINGYGAWEATIDAAADIPMASPTYLGRDVAKLDGYAPGSNGTLFSPQGGMRMSLNDLIKVGKLLHKRPDFHKASWSYDGANGDNEDAHFLSFGPGSYVYDADISPIPGVPLVGHLGWAYGAHTAMFIIPDTDISFAFARLGSGADDATMSGTRANQFTVHQALFDELAPILRTLI